MELRDKNGLTEAEFLRQYQPGKYERPSVTVDILVFSKTPSSWKLLLVQRKGHPYLGCWALPGGFANPNETLEEAAARELQEETHVQGLCFAPVGVYSDPGRDPRGWVISEAFAAVGEEETLMVHADDDAADAGWFQVEMTDSGTKRLLQLSKPGMKLTACLDVETVSTPFGDRTQYRIQQAKGLAFDHARIIAEALEKLQDLHS